VATATAGPAWTGGRPLSHGLFGDLIWRRPRPFSRELILEAGSERLATLRWERWFSFEAVAESADGRWIIGRRRAASLLGNHVMRDAGSGVEVAELKRGWRGTGVARFASGVEYRWEREGFWRPRYSWVDGDRRPLLTFRPLLGFGRSYEMTVDPAARVLAELPALVLLGAYTMAIISAQSRSS
jgi:hypothetical protein